MKHRSDIDGLRALAIMPVIFFHFTISRFSGGYLGVDIFFLISGFLITGIIDREISNGGFSVGKFYERRVRRIFPSLFVVLTFCTAIGYFVLLPREFEQLGQTIASTTFFVSNFLFYTQDNYFAAASVFKPLLHTWSLAVEEQFYLVFPLLLIALRKAGSRRTMLVTLAVLAVLSLGLNIYYLSSHRAAAFYLPLSRAWELLAGALLALGAVPPLKNTSILGALGGVGLMLIAFSVVFLEETGAGKLPAAILPCLGTALILYAGGIGPNIASRLLGNPIVVYIGTISYSLYLWHWPLLVFYRLNFGFAMHLWEKLLLLALTFVAAALSTRYLETPIRKGRDYPGPPRALYAGSVAMACFGILGLIIVLSRGVSERFPAEVNRVASFLEYGNIPSFRTDVCFLAADSNDIRYYARDVCLRRAPDRKNILILGDSHAAQLWAGLAAAYPEENFQQATVAKCIPVLDYHEPGAYSLTCKRMLDFMFHRYLPANKPDAIIVSAAWNGADVTNLERTLRFLKSYQQNVVVIGPVIEYETPLPRILAFSMLRHDPGMISKAENRMLALDREIEGIAARAGVRYISMERTLCATGRCDVTTSDGSPMDFDADHLTEQGSRFVAARWKAQGVLRF